MKGAVITTLGVLCACVGAVVWVIDLTTLQPLTEPGEPWSDLSVGNNTYWARDLRLLAIAAALAGLVLVFRGSRCRTGLAVLGALGWLGLDVWLDRIDLTGRTATLVLSIAGCAVLVGVSRLDRRRPGQHCPRTLTGTAAICAAMATMVWLVESAVDADMADPGVVAARALLGVLLSGGAFLCASAASPRPTDHPSIGVGVLTLAGSGAGLLALDSLLFDRPTDTTSRFLIIGGLAAIHFVGVTFLVSGQHLPAIRDWRRYLVVAACAVVGYPILIILTTVITMSAVPAGDLLTWLAANPPVNDADSDTLAVLTGLITGLVFAYLITAVNQRGIQRKDPVGSSVAIS